MCHCVIREKHNVSPIDEYEVFSLKIFMRTWQFLRVLVSNGCLIAVLKVKMSAANYNTHHITFFPWSSTILVGCRDTFLLVQCPLHWTLLLLYTHLPCHNDSIIVKTDAHRKTHEERKQEGRHKKEERRKKTSLPLYLPLTFIAIRKSCSRFACERVLETEHKLHILTPLLWPSRCVFLVLLMLGSTPSGLSEGPLSLVWPSLPHLVSNPLGVCWQLHRGFSEFPLGRVWPSLPHLVSTVWKSAGNCIGGFQGPPRSGVAFPTTSRL